MKLYQSIFLLPVILLASACEDFLSKVPSPTTNAPITNVSQLRAIYDDALSFMEESNPFACYMHDDSDISIDLYKASPRSFSVSNILYYHLFKTEGIVSQGSDALWRGQFSNIFTANTIINSVENVTGDEGEKNRVRCDAYFLRAYSYFLMAQYYCLPYSEANKGALGLPKRLKTDFEESLTRISLEETYQLILGDLAEAANTPDNALDTDHPWRVTKATVNALYARIYLTMGNYKEAQTAAERALEGAPELLDLNELGYADVNSYPAEGDMPAQDVYTCEIDKWSPSKYLYWKESLFPRFTYARSQWFIPSAGLAEQFDQENDRRFILFFVEHANRPQGIPYEAYAYRQFDEGRYIVSGLTTGELLIIKAEAQIRQGAWQEGLKTLDRLRVKRYNSGTYVSLSANNQGEALKIVLNERRREMPFSTRIPDIKRYSANETPDDDVTVVKNFFEISMTEVFMDKPKTYTIPSNSPLWAMPINDVERSSSKGAIEQNPY